MTRFANQRIVPQAPLVIEGERGTAIVPRQNLTVRQAFEQAFIGIGGVPALTEWARDHPTEFYKILARLLPVEVTGDPARPLVIGVRIESDDDED